MPQEERKEPVPAEKRTTAKAILVVEDDEDIGEFIASAEKRQIIVVEKPFDLDEFLLTVQRLLGNRSS
ncbi:MAG TPA: hypothetical protein VKB35_01360, partial [Ktedonobacteraceae bacterium]|nr:hypothetical protein [Ktedonobacteraceae bacterium]